MRLPEVERGDSLRHRTLIAMISRLSGMRLPDAARVAFYHREFAGPTLGAWTQHVMRGPSPWTVSERELMAASVASWNACPFCVGAHGAVAVLGLGRDTVDAALHDPATAPIPDRLKAALVFLRTATVDPDGLSTADADIARSAGLGDGELYDAAAVAAVFNVITRYANALAFTIPSDEEFDKAAGMLLRRGYS